VTRTPKSDTFSKPVLRQTLTVRSQQAHYVLKENRSFYLVVRAFYSLTVVLRIIGDDEQMDQVEKHMRTRLGEVHKLLQDEHDRMQHLLDENAITTMPEYTHPREVTLSISSPQLAQFVRLIELLDRCMMLLDALWFAGLIVAKDRRDATKRMRRAVYTLGREMIALEKRARASAVRAGKSAQIAEAEAAAGEPEITGSLVDDDEAPVAGDDAALKAAAQPDTEAGGEDDGEAVTALKLAAG
jgi:hypothetical protein